MTTSRLHGGKICVLRLGPLVFDKRTQLVARSLARHGAEVRVIALRFGSSPAFEGSGYSVVELTPDPPSDSQIRLVRVVANLLKEARTLRRMAREVRRFAPDIVHCMNVQTLLPGVRGGGKALYIYDSREHFATTGHVKPHVRRWWMWLERRYVPRTAAVLTVSEPIARDLAQRYGVDSPVVIYNGCEDRVTAPQPVHTPLRLLHLGKAYVDRNVEELLDLLVAVGPGVTLALQAWGERAEDLRRAVQERGLEASVEFVDPVPPDDIVARISDYDVGVINVRPDTENLKWSAGNKIFEYMAAGLAMLVPQGLPVTDEIVDRAGCGVVFEPGTMAAAVREMQANPEQVGGYKRNAVAASPEYSWQEQERKLMAVYERLMQDGPRERR